MKTDAHDEFVRIDLSKGYQAIISPCDADLQLIKWSAITGNSGKVYATHSVRINGKRTFETLHQVILSRILGRELKAGEEVDHIDGDGLNCCRSNLRLATRLQNARNMRKSRANTSGYKGVTLEKESGKWRAQITSMGKKYNLGRFLTPEEAHEAYCKAAKEYFGEFARFE